MKNKFLSKKRNVLDAKDVSWTEILQHVIVNFLFGVTSGIVIAFVALFLKDISMSNALKLSGMYFVYKQVESRILNRNKYVSNLGKNYIFPIPSTIGFVLGAYLSTLI